MKTKLFISTIFFFILSFKCYAQDDKYESFRDYLVTHCKPPKTVYDLCGFQIAVVKLSTNKSGLVVNYIFLNPASDSLKSTFKSLIGYKFPLNLNMQNKTFVFAYTFFNLKSDCVKTDNPDVQKVFEITYQCLTKQMALNPKTIFYDTTLTSIGLDPNPIR